MTKQEQSFLMASRLKSLREQHKLSCKELKDELFKQFGISISRDSLMSYEIQTEHHSKIKDGKYPNLNMGVEYLNALAQFYWVSADYLLGFTDIPNTDTNVQSVHKLTGLSVSALCKLAEMNIDHRKAFCDIISLLIENPNAEFLLALITGMISCSYNGTENKTVEINLDGHELNLYNSTLLTTVFQTHLIQDIPGIIEEYKKQFDLETLQKAMMEGKDNADNP